MNIWMFEKYSMKHQITYEDYANAKRACKDFEINKLGDYHDLYV